MTNIINNYSTDFDSLAIKKIRDGDISEFEKLFRHYYHQLQRFSYRFVCDLQIAEDIVQDVFLSMWMNRKKLDPDKNIKTYLYTVVRNRSLNYMRHLKVEQQYRIDNIESSNDKNSPDEVIKYEEFQTAIENSINELPLKCRIIFCMNRFDKLKYSEIAEIQKISVKTVETHMSHALKHLKKQLQHFIISFLF